MLKGQYEHIDAEMDQWRHPNHPVVAIAEAVDPGDVVLWIRPKEA